MTSKSLPKSEHFTYHELADGVWAAIVIDNRPGGKQFRHRGPR